MNMFFIEKPKKIVKKKKQSATTAGQAKKDKEKGKNASKK